MAKILTRAELNSPVSEREDAVWVQHENGKEIFDLVGKLREGSIIFAGTDWVEYQQTMPLNNLKPTREKARELAEKLGFDYVLLTEERPGSFYLAQFYVETSTQTARA